MSAGVPPASMVVYAMTSLVPTTALVQLTTMDITVRYVSAHNASPMITVQNLGFPCCAPQWNTIGIVSVYETIRCPYSTGEYGYRL